MREHAAGCDTERATGPPVAPRWDVVARGRRRPRRRPTRRTPTSPLGYGAAAAAVIAAATGVAPWHRSGATTRDGYEIVLSAGNLGLVEGSTLSTIATVWLFVPAIAAASLLLAALGRPVLVATAAVVAGVVSAVVAGFVLAAPDSLVAGPAVAGLAGLAAVVLGVLTGARAWRVVDGGRTTADADAAAPGRRDIEAQGDPARRVARSGDVRDGGGRPVSMARGTTVDLVETMRERPVV